MDGLIDIDAARALVSDAALWPRVRDFLWNFAAQIHPSWLDTLVFSRFESALVSPPEIPRSRNPGIPANHQTTKLPNCQTLLSSPRVSRWLLSELSVAPCFHAFPSDDLSRLLLLDSDTLVSIARWLGALATADALRRVTRGPDVAALRAALPGVYPAVFSYAPYFAKSALPPAADPSPDAIQSLGFALLHASLAHLPPPLLRRLALKLPKGALPDQPTTQPPNRQTTKLLLKLRFPEAFSLCCS